MPIQYRNAKFVSETSIDCEVEHPKYGWIPYTLDPSDTSSFFDVNSLIDKIKVSGDAVPYVHPTDDYIKSYIKKDIVSIIKSERDRRINEGGYEVDGKWFYSNQFNRIKQIGFYILGNNIPDNCKLETMDGTIININSILAKKLTLAIVESDNKFYTYADNLISMVNLSKEPSTIDYISGWPKIYGE